jgi:hypothetical protein
MYALNLFLGPLHSTQTLQRRDDLRGPLGNLLVAESSFL